MESPLENTAQMRGGGSHKNFNVLFLVKLTDIPTMQDLYFCSRFFSFHYFSAFDAELQAAVCIHRDPAPIAKYSEGFLEAGAGLSLHIHSDAE